MEICQTIEISKTTNDETVQESTKLSNNCIVETVQETPFSRKIRELLHRPTLKEVIQRRKNEMLGKIVAKNNRFQVYN